MYKRIKFFLLLVFILANIFVFSQEAIKLQLKERKESYVKIDTKYLKELEHIEDFSIDHSKPSESFGVYLNKNSYQYLIEKNIPFSLQTPPSMEFVAKMANSIKTAKKWDAYPTFETYVAMMRSFVDSFPNYCQLDTIGYSVKNRLILSLKISQNVKQTTPEKPQVFLTSSMHGDELVGYVIMLRFADYLLKNKNKPKIAEIIQNMELYINPLSNPDGAYQNDNATVNGATRRNANGVDLNRNFPIVKHSYIAKKSATKRQIEPENVAMIDYMKKHKFVLSVNFHGGDEVLNYPWDSFQERHNDDKWFQHICRTYADTVHTIDEDYLDGYQNGITNGYDWYSIDGGRQDYVTHFLQGREITAELSHKKLPSSSTLPSYWNKNKKALIQFVKQALYGVAGVISDETEKPLQADVKVLNHDPKPSVKSDSTGHFFRFLTNGTYTFEFTAKGYDTLTQIIDIQNFKQKKIAIKLTPTLLQSITLNAHKINIKKGESKKLIANILPQYAKDTSITWESKNKEIATVENGIVSAISSGETTIFARANDSTNLYDSCIVVVHDIVLVQSIHLSKNKISIEIGKSKKLIAKVLPKNATDTSVRWESKDKEIATVKNGIVSAISSGETTIFARANDSTSLYDSCIVAVLTSVKDFRAENIKIYPNPAINSFTVIFDDNFDFPANLSLINAMGVVVKKQESITEKSVNITTDLFKNGVYIVKIENKNTTFLKKIFIYKK